MGEYNAATGVYTGNASTEVTISGGTTTTTTELAEFNTATGFEVAGDIMSTVKGPNGSSVISREVNLSDTIETHGQRMTVAMAMQLGFLTKDAGGNFMPTAKGTLGAKAANASKGTLELASGGTAEEAQAADFRADDLTEKIFSMLVADTTPDTQVAAIDSALRNGGEVDLGIIERMASQAGVEPAEMTKAVEEALGGMQEAVLKRLEGFGVYDRDAFTDFINSDPATYARMVESGRDLMMSNSTKGFEKLAEEFTLSADVIDPEAVGDALEAAGIPYTRTANGGALLDLRAQGLGQVTFRQAVQHGFIKLSRNT